MCPPLPFCHTEVRGQEASIPLRDLWSSLARSGPAPQSHSWWGPRERQGTGSGHCMSSLDAHSRQKSVSDEGLEGSRGVESGAGYTWGFSYFVGSACNIPTSPRSQSPQSDALPVSYGVCWGNTYTNGKLPYVRMFSVLPTAFSCWVYFINRLEELQGTWGGWLLVWRENKDLLFLRSGCNYSKKKKIILWVVTPSAWHISGGPLIGHMWISSMVQQWEYDFQMAKGVTGSPWENRRWRSMLSLMLLFSFWRWHWYNCGVR